MDALTLQRVELVAVHFVNEPHDFYQGFGHTTEHRDEHAICEVNVYYLKRKAERRGLVVTTERGRQAQREGRM